MLAQMVWSRTTTCLVELGIVMIELLLIALAAFILLYPQILEGYLRGLDLLNGKTPSKLS